MKKLNFKCTILPYSKLIKSGYNLSVFDYMADLIIDKDTTLKNALVVEAMAVVIDDNKTQVIIINLADNPKIKVVKIDRSNIN
jgi:hypothetical protein